MSGERLPAGDPRAPWSADAALDRASVVAVDVTKSFGGVPALRGVDLRVEPGAVVALLGPNAAGKTTLLRILAGALRPDAGEVAVCGRDVRREGPAVRALVGFVAHQTLAYPHLTALENLRFYARMYGAPATPESLEARLDAVGLWQRRHDRAGTFSRGLGQRLAIARATLHEPAVLLLDEPHAGLDARAALELDSALSRMVAGGRTVLIATHDLERARSIASGMVILHRGRVAWFGARDEVPDGDLAALYDSVTGDGAGSEAERHRSQSGEPWPARGASPDAPSVSPSAGFRRATHAAPGVPAAVRLEPDRTARSGPAGRSVVRAIAGKDLASELRSREIVPPVLVFALLIVVVFHFAFPAGVASRGSIAPGALWVALLFGSTLGLGRGMAAEADSGGLTGLALSPADGGSVFLGKWLAGYAFALLVAGFLVPAMLILLAMPPPGLTALVLVVALGLAGWVAAGTLIAGVAVHTRAREVLLPVLLYPLVLPLVVAAVQGTAAALGSSGGLAAPVALIAAYDVTFLVLGFLLFPSILEGAS